MRYLLLILFFYSGYSQVGINTTTPNSQSVLEVNSSTQGILLPRVALQSTILPAPLSTNVKGITVYNTATASTGVTAVFPGMYYNDGVNWIRLTPNTVKPGEMKYSFSLLDHKGWYLLNGRAKATLSAAAQANATAIGIGANLPNSTDKFLKPKTGAEVLGSTGGANTFTVAQTNLPNVNFTGTTDNTGAHTHNVDSYLGIEVIGLLSAVPLLSNWIVSSVATTTATTTARTTATNGSHSHTVSVNTGGSGTAVNRTPSYLATNVFIYLGL
ncbi:MAG: hypothetical protein V4548_02690 [Bacteroidota bacterium]